MDKFNCIVIKINSEKRIIRTCISEHEMSGSNSLPLLIY